MEKPLLQLQDCMGRRQGQRLVSNLVRRQSSVQLGLQVTGQLLLVLQRKLAVPQEKLLKMGLQKLQVQLTRLIVLLETPQMQQQQAQKLQDLLLLLSELKLALKLGGLCLQAHLQQQQAQLKDVDCCRA